MLCVGLDTGVVLLLDAATGTRRRPAPSDRRAYVCDCVCVGARACVIVCAWVRLRV
jgi:hypothetical protein